ncbi:MAG: hypothetical protein WCJ67_01090 [Thermoleophilia bacterium]
MPVVAFAAIGVVTPVGSSFPFGTDPHTTSSSLRGQSFSSILGAGSVRGAISVLLVILRNCLPEQTSWHRAADHLGMIR